LAIKGPPWVRAANDFATVTLPERDCDAIRDLLVAERPGTVIEIGLAYGSSALAIGEALISVGGDRHVILDPFQDSGFRDAGWDVCRHVLLADDRTARWAGCSRRSLLARLRRLAISRPIWAGGRKRLRTPRRDDCVRCGCPIRRWSQDSTS
jgi:hypothetical protein